ncbi:MAG: FecR domain-containing protein [Sphingomonadales bacterium]|nr:FecR domain-containing protein [Sphingomonadales bacterium]
MPTFESSRTIDETASDWTARLDRGQLSPGEEAELEAWLQGDPRRRGALLRAQAIALQSESARALGPRFDPADFAPLAAAPAPEPADKGGISRRRSLIWTGSAIAGATLIALGVGMPAAGTTISTGRGELRLVPLKDGSTVMLNTDTSITIHDGADERRVTLLNGEAFFSVARGRTKPLVVEVDGRRLTTAQAMFNLRKLHGVPVNLLVHQGEVRLAPPSWGDQRAIAVTSDMKLDLAEPRLFRSSPPERPSPVPSDAATRGLAWLEGKIAFEGETLQTAADSFARYSDTRIVIRDASLAREPVTGLFAANDPAGFSRAVAVIFDAKVDRQGDTIVLSRRPASR